LLGVRELQNEGVRCSFAFVGGTAPGVALNQSVDRESFSKFEEHVGMQLQALVVVTLREHGGLSRVVARNGESHH